MSIIYHSRRIGQHGKEFYLYKFRTMKSGMEWMGTSTADDDSRITKIGYWLRKTKLDELPQIWNWMKGDIKLIGWRPEVPQYLNTIPEEVLKTKPGIIGYATLWDIDEGNLLKGQRSPDEYYEKYILPRKRTLELWYVHNKTLWLDIKIIWLTIKKLLLRHG